MQEAFFMLHKLTNYTNTTKVPSTQFEMDFEF